MDRLREPHDLFDRLPDPRKNGRNLVGDAWWRNSGDLSLEQTSSELRHGILMDKIPVTITHRTWPWNASITGVTSRPGGGLNENMCLPQAGSDYLVRL
jgi:hypothetical protein